MKAIKIDAEKGQVYEVEVAKGLQPIYDAIGNNCSLIECPIAFENGDGIFVDEEITYRVDDIVGAWSMEGYDFGRPILNNGLICGSDQEGERVDCESDLEEIRSKVKFFKVIRRFGLEPR